MCAKSLVEIGWKSIPRKNQKNRWRECQDVAIETLRVHSPAEGFGSTIPLRNAAETKLVGWIYSLVLSFIPLPAVR